MCCWFFVVVFAHFIRCFFYVCVFKWILSRKCCFSHLVHLQMKHYSIVAHLIYEVNYSLGEYVYILEASNFRLNQDCCGITVKKNFTSVLYWLLYFFNKRFGLFLSLFLLFSPLFFYLQHTFSTLYYMLNGCTFQHASLIFRWKLDGTNTILNSHILWIGLKSHNSNEPWLKEVLENLLPFE